VQECFSNFSTKAAYLSPKTRVFLILDSFNVQFSLLFCFRSVTKQCRKMKVNHKETQGSEELVCDCMF